MKSILQRIQKLEEQVGLKKHSVIKESGSIIQIDPSYKYYDVEVQERYFSKTGEIDYVLFVLPIKVPGEFTVTYRHQFEILPGEVFETENAALLRVKQLYSSKLVIPKNKLENFKKELFRVKNSSKLNFKPKPFGIKKGEYLFFDYSINEINKLINSNTTYRSLKKLGVFLRTDSTEFSGYPYDGLSLLKDLKDNKLHLEFETKNGSTIFTNEAAIDNFRNYSKNMIFYSAGVILPKTSILTRADLDNTLKVMLDSYINREEIENTDDEE